MRVRVRVFQGEAEVGEDGGGGKWEWQRSVCRWEKGV